MDDYERELMALDGQALFERYEDLTQKLLVCTQERGDYHRHMLCRRVILRRMSHTLHDFARHSGNPYYLANPYYLLHAFDPSKETTSEDKGNAPAS